MPKLRQLPIASAQIRVGMPISPIEIARIGCVSASSACAQAAVSATTSRRFRGMTAILHMSAPSAAIRQSRAAISSASGVFSKSWQEPITGTPASRAARAIREKAASPTLSSTSSASQSRSRAVSGVDIQIKPIVNYFFGETVTVSGLITGQDLVAQLKGEEADEILITESMLRQGEEIFLDDMTLEQAQQQLGIRITPVPDDGADLLYALRGTEE